MTVLEYRIRALADLEEENEFIPPTLEAVDVAVGVGKRIQEYGIQLLKRIVPDGDGGLVFGGRIGAGSKEIEVSRDGAVEFVECRNKVVTLREKIAIRPGGTRA